jgi:hypothetical protein
MFYFIHCVLLHFIVQNLDGIFNIGQGASLSWSWFRVAYQFKWR